MQPPRSPQTDSLAKPLPPSPPMSPKGGRMVQREQEQEDEHEQEQEQEHDREAEQQRKEEVLLHESALVASPELTDSPSPRSTSRSTFETPIVRPIAERRSTAPEATSPTTPLNSKFATLTIEPRSRSPYSRPHYRSHSSNSTLLSPGFPRSKSLPYSDTGRSSSPLLRPASPYSPGARRVSPLRRPFEESYSFSGVEIDQTIGENDELQLDLKPRPLLTIDSSDTGHSTPTTPSSPLMSSGHFTFPRTRRRPSSPLHLSSPGYNSRLHASASSPTLRSPGPSPVDPAKYNESYPAPVAPGGLVDKSSGHPPTAITNLANGAPYYATSVLSGTSASSMPSTPSSFRSRSPSISSLETIPDSPDAEAAATAATEQDRDALARLRAVAEKRDESGLRTRGRTMGRTSDSTGMVGSAGAGTTEKRKRWSVCGAERRGDLEMETIWED